MKLCDFPVGKHFLFPFGKNSFAPSLEEHKTLTKKFRLCKKTVLFFLSGKFLSHEAAKAKIQKGNRFVYLFLL